MRCESCVFYDDGNCRYNPPSLFQNTETNMVCSYWPKVEATDICSKYLLVNELLRDVNKI